MAEIKRIQKVNDDTILDITTDTPVVRRLSKNNVKRRISYLEQSIAKFQAELSEAKAELAMIADEESKQ